MTEQDDDQPRGDLVSVALLGLSAASQEQIRADHLSQMHERVIEVAMEWQQTSMHAHLWELGARPHGRGHVFALAGQIAAAGEQLSLANAASVEVALWRERNKDAVAREMGMRAMAEAQSLFVMGTGHALANAAIRALSLDSDLRSGLIDVLSSRQGKPPTLDPFSPAPSDWVSLNAKTGRALKTVAESSSSAQVEALIEPVVGFSRCEHWRGLQERRGEDFHRWRPQTHGVSGVTRQNPWTEVPGGISLSAGPGPYDEARGLAERAAQIADSAMIDLAESMDAFLSRWPAASERLGGPIFG